MMTKDLFVYSDKQLLTHCCCNVGLGDNYETVHKRKILTGIRPFYDSDIIKVITGIRRCGKSCLMKMIIEELKKKGVDDKYTIYIPLDKRGYTIISTPEQLEEKIDAQVTDGEFYYLLIDEVQNVKGFEKDNSCLSGRRALFNIPDRLQFISSE